MSRKNGSKRKWWAYIPDAWEAGCVVEAHTLDEALHEAQLMFSTVESWLHFPETTYEIYIYELGELHCCSVTEGVRSYE